MSKNEAYSALEKRFDELFDGPESAMECIYDLQHHLDEARARCERLEKAGKSLVNEVSGIIGIAGDELRLEIGNTNFHCLQHRLRLMCAALNSEADEHDSI